MLNYKNIINSAIVLLNFHRRCRRSKDERNIMHFHLTSSRRQFRYRTFNTDLPYATTYFPTVSTRRAIIYDRRRVTFFKRGKVFDESATSLCPWLIVYSWNGPVRFIWEEFRMITVSFLLPRGEVMHALESSSEKVTFFSWQKTENA